MTGISIGMGIGLTPSQGVGLVAPPAGTAGQPIGLLLILTKAS